MVPVSAWTMNRAQLTKPRAYRRLTPNGILRMNSACQSSSTFKRSWNQPYRLRCGCRSDGTASLTLAPARACQVESPDTGPEVDRSRAASGEHRVVAAVVQPAPCHQCRTHRHDTDRGTAADLVASYMRS